MAKTRRKNYFVYVIGGLCFLALILAGIIFSIYAIQKIFDLEQNALFLPTVKNWAVLIAVSLMSLYFVDAYIHKNRTVWFVIVLIIIALALGSLIII